VSKRIGGVIGPLVGLLVICIGLTIMSDAFLTYDNLFNITKQVAVNLILACGATLVIILAGIDLSVGSMLALAGAVAAKAIQTWGIPAGIAAGILVGIAAGLFNGSIISYGRVAPFIVTLGSMTILRSLTLVFTGGRPISGFPDAFLTIGDGAFLGIPVPVLIATASVIICSITLRYTRFGRYV